MTTYQLRNKGNNHVMADPDDLDFAGKDEAGWVHPGRPQRELLIGRGETFTSETDLNKIDPSKFELLGVQEDAEPYPSWDESSSWTEGQMPAMEPVDLFQPPAAPVNALTELPMSEPIATHPKPSKKTNK